MSTENPDVYEATCLDCNTSKSYFTPQGVTFFKMNHQGHAVKVKEEPQPSQQTPGAASEPEAQGEAQVAEPVSEVEAPSREHEQQVDETAREEVKLNNLVVDVVDEETGRTVEVYGVAGGREKFSKGFDMRNLGGLNLFLESGSYTDPASLTTYCWTPDKIDLSDDVAKILDAPAAGGSREGQEAERRDAGPAMGEAPVKKQKQEIRVVPSAAQGVTEEALLGKLSYVQPTEEYRLESLRVSKVLRKFRWNTELPYVIGALFDDLLSVQAQAGMVKSSLIEAVSKMGYDFIAVEAPAGVVTVWFRKTEGEQMAESERIPLEFGR